MKYYTLLNEIDNNNNIAPKTMMSFLKNIQQKASIVLSQLKKDSPLEIITQKLNEIIPSFDNEPAFFSSQIIKSAEQPVIVYIDLMVQDIREQEYSYSYLIKKPISQSSEIIGLRYGLNFTENILEKIDSDQYYPIMSSGDIIIGQSQKYQSSWLRNWSNNDKDLQVISSIKIIANQNSNFKLGQQIKALCIYNPQYKCLYFLRNATQEEIIKYKLDFPLYSILQKTKQPKQVKNMLISLLSKSVPKNYAMILLFTIITPEAYFIDGPNISELLKQFLPRVCHLKIKVPFKDSLVPFKNQQGELVNTPLQLSSEKSFVILDFSEFSDKNQIKIESEEIDNLKALKIFVEEAQIVHRWQYGESLFSHNHSGIIIKASSILTPNFKSNHNFETKDLESNPFKLIEESQKNEFRIYIQKCKLYNPKLGDQARDKIQKFIKQDRQKNPEKKLDIQNIIKFAQLNAMSEWRSEIEVEDYFIGRDLVSDF